METITGVVHTHYHHVIIMLMELFLLVQEVLQLQHVLRNALLNITNHTQMINSTVLVHIQLQEYKILCKSLQQMVQLQLHSLFMKIS